MKIIRCSGEVLILYVNFFFNTYLFLNPPFISLQIHKSSNKNPHKQSMSIQAGGGGTPSVGCSYLRWAAPKNGEKWLGENIKTWIENRATLRHSMANLPSFLLHKLFLIYMLKFFTKVLPNFAKIFRMLGRIQFALYVRITYDRKVVYIRLVSQSTVGFLDFRL